jgi:hypothetical protein
MKITSYMLLAGMLMISMAEAGENTMNDRIQALMSELKVEPASDHEVSARSQGALSIQKLKTMDNLSVRHKTEGEGEGGTTSEKLLFSGANGKIKAVGKVEYKKSARAAQKALFKRLAQNSLPLEILLKRYEIAEGPGDICIVEKIFDKATGRFVVDGSQVHFIRGNVAVTVRSEDEGVNTKELARQMDQVLVEGNE